MSIKASCSLSLRLSLPHLTCNKRCCLGNYSDHTANFQGLPNIRESLLDALEDDMF